MTGVKIVTIGGGSSYTPELIDGFIKRKDTIKVDELWLVDIEAGREKMEIVADLGRRMIKKAGLETKIITTLNRREALKGANFVTTQIRVGLLEARMKDEEIAVKNGIIGQETNGIGGMFKALRTVPVILDIVKDIQEICPEAWLINFTNPAGMITEAVYRYTSYRRIVGLCNVPVNMVAKISKLLGVSEDDVTLELQGVNHHDFITDVTVDKKSRFEEVLQKCLNNQNDEVMKNIYKIDFLPEVIRGFHAIPNDYLNYYINTDLQLEKMKEQYKTGTLRAREVKKIEDKLFEIYKDKSLDVKPKELDKRGGARYSDAACNLINSIYNDKQDIQYVNTQNNGTYSYLDPSYVIECACVITKDGPKPIKINKVNERIFGTICSIKAFELSCVDAAVSGNKDIAISALTLNKLVGNQNVAKKAFNELLEAHKDYLPQFFVR